MNLTEKLNKPIVRFLVGGALNTGVSYLVYLVFLNFWSYHISYTLSFVAGIVFSYFYNSKLVFNSTISWQKMLKYPLVYLVQYMLNLLLLYLLIDNLNINDKVAPLIATIAVIPVTFVLSKLILTDKKQ